MVRVFYGQNLNAVLGGIMFYEGVADFENDAEGIKFAEMFYRQYEVVEAATPKKTARRKVKKDE